MMSTVGNQLRTGYKERLHNYAIFKRTLVPPNTYNDGAFKTGVKPTEGFSLTKSRVVLFFIKGHGHSSGGHLPAMFSKVRVAGALLLESHS